MISERERKPDWELEMPLVFPVLVYCRVIMIYLSTMLYIHLTTLNVFFFSIDRNSRGDGTFGFAYMMQDDGHLTKDAKEIPKWTSVFECGTNCSNEVDVLCDILGRTR
jgi:hypothetical protein